jgi:glutamate-1-semialdehyde aminotransferase
MAAARAVLKQLKSHGASLQHHLNQRTSQFCEELNVYFKEDKLPLQIENFGSLFGFTTLGRFAVSQASTSPNILQFLIYYNLLHKGILLRGNGGFISTAHTDEDIKSIIQAVRDTMTELRKGGLF